jgi:hypothetical protein
MFLEELAGHGKDRRMIQPALPLEMPKARQVGDRVYNGSPESPGTIVSIKRGKAHVVTDDGREIHGISLSSLNLCDPDYKPLKAIEPQDLEAIALEEIQRARDKYLAKNYPLEPCLPISTYSPESEDLPSPPMKWGELKQSNLSKSTSMPSQFCDRTTPASQFTATSKTTNVLGVTSISSRQDSPVLEQASPAQERDSITNNQISGLKLCELFELADPSSLSSKTLQACSVEVWMESFGDFPKAGTMRNGKLSQQPHLKPPTVENDYLSLPTPNASSGANSRPAGQTKCETWFRSNGLLADSQCLSPQIMAQLLGFPMDWTRCLWELTEARPAELEADTYLAEPLSQPKPRSPLDELSTFIPSSMEQKPLDHSAETLEFRLRGEQNRPENLSSSAAKKLPLEHERITQSRPTGDRPSDGHELTIPQTVTVWADEAEPIHNREDRRGDRHHHEQTTVNISSAELDWIGLYDRLAELERKRNAIRESGPVAAVGIWIEYGKVAKRKFRQAYYRSKSAIFPARRQGSFAKSESGLVKRCYIGEENSREVKKAGEAIARRNELERIAKEVKLIERKLCE